MGKKKRDWPDLQQKLDRPWCYYCERDFDDLKILISHQKAKHFKCDKCNRRLNTAGGLSVHMTQVHKETLQAVENAIPGRSGLDVEIFGVEGIPADIVAAHNNAVMKKHFEDEQERARLTGNPIRGLTHGGNQGQPSKRAKVETGEELKKKLAEWRANKKAGNTSSGDVTPQSTPNLAQVNPSGYTPASMAPYNAFGGMQTSPPPLSANPFGVVPGGAYVGPLPHQPYTGGGSFMAGQGYGGNQWGAYPQQFPQGAPIPTHNRSYGAAPPPQAPFTYGQGAPAPSVSPPMNGGMPSHGQHPLPPMPGAPLKSTISDSVDDLIANVTGGAAATPTTTVKPPQSTTPVGDAKPPAATASAEEPVPAAAPKPQKPQKQVKLIYSNQAQSPEEMLSENPKYTFTPSHKPETVLGTPTPAVTGTVKEGA